MSGINNSPGVLASRTISTTAPATGGGGLSTARTLGIVGRTVRGRQRVAATIGLASGRPWTALPSAVDNMWRGIAWSPELGLFAAVASTGTGDRVMTSPDGLVWTTRASAVDNAWLAITWASGGGLGPAGLGLFVAVAGDGSGDLVMTSPDGIEWTTQASAADNQWQAVTWSPELGLFVAVATSGTGNRVMTSPNGIDWTTQASAADNHWRGVAWSPELGLFAAVAAFDAPPVMTSPDGIAWTLQAGPNDDWDAITWAPELRLFVAVGDGEHGSGVMTSPNGIEWTPRLGATPDAWNAIAWAPELGRLAAVANGGFTLTRIMMSPNGINWFGVFPPEDSIWCAIAWSPELGRFVAVASAGTNRVMTSSPMIAPPTPATLGTLSATTGSIGGGALLVGQTASGTVSVAGATTDMVVQVSPNTYPGDGSYWYGYISATDTVTVKVGVVVDGTPTASTYDVRVLP